jgi:predicted nucleotidyltransferase
MSYEVAIIAPLLKAFHIRKAALFGSVARGETNPSDIDILIEPPPGMGIFMFLELKETLKNALGKEVDPVTFEGVHPHIKQRVLKEAVSIL